MRYRNSALYTLKCVAEMLEEDEDFLHDCSIEMFSEDGCLSAYDDYPASELSQPKTASTTFGRSSTSAGLRATHRPNLPQKTIARNHSHRGLGRMVTFLQARASKQRDGKTGGGPPPQPSMQLLDKPFVGRIEKLTP
ncbi:hypothetical protein [Mesorhizobium sp. M1322]|uniref:hypothetical protein n=1 Tax=Mesorhizobium sp. M1322 TaxID=2957081 RepID=UPI003336EEF8